MLCYNTKTRTRTNGGTQNEHEIKIKIAAMRTNKNENDSGQKRHSVIKNFRSHQQLHGPVAIACCGHSAEDFVCAPASQAFFCMWHNVKWMT